MNEFAFGIVVGIIVVALVGHAILSNRKNRG